MDGPPPPSYVRLVAARSLRGLKACPEKAALIVSRPGERSRWHLVKLSSPGDGATCQACTSLAGGVLSGLLLGRAEYKKAAFFVEDALVLSQVGLRRSILVARGV